MISDILLDIIKHTANLGIIELVKLDGTKTEIAIAAIDDDRSVVINGKINTAIPGLIGTVGLSRISVLNGYLKFDPFASDNAIIKINTQKRGSEEVPAEIAFDSRCGHTAFYRFMAPEIANETINVPPFKGATFQVSIVPAKSSLKDLSYMSGILGGLESLFSVQTTTDGDLEFLIGSGPTDRTKIKFASNIKGELKHSWSYPLATVLSILKLYDTSESVNMSFSDQGALKIEIKSGIGEYQYILPARSK
jgi:hypothetical protein